MKRKLTRLNDKATKCNLIEKNIYIHIPRKYIRRRRSKLQIRLCLTESPQRRVERQQHRLKLEMGKKASMREGERIFVMPVPVPSPHHHITIYEARVTMSDTHPTRPGHLKNESAIFLRADTSVTLLRHSKRDTAPGSTRAERVPTYHAILSAASTR